jgi:hypothetical protein
LLITLINESGGRRHDLQVVGTEGAFPAIEIKYLGFHNERTWEPSWIVELREELDRRGKVHVQIVAGDCGPGAGYQVRGHSSGLRPSRQEQVALPPFCA